MSASASANLLALVSGSPRTLEVEPATVRLHQTNHGCSTGTLSPSRLKHTTDTAPHRYTSKCLDQASIPHISILLRVYINSNAAHPTAERGWHISTSDRSMGSAERRSWSLYMSHDSTKESEALAYPSFYFTSSTSERNPSLQLLHTGLQSLTRETFRGDTAAQASLV